MSLFNLGIKKSVATAKPNKNKCEMTKKLVKKINSLPENLSITVLGIGCSECLIQYENVEIALNELNVNADIKFVTEAKEIMSFGSVSMPAIIVNGRLASWGRLVSPAGVKSLLYKILS